MPENNHKLTYIELFVLAIAEATQCFGSLKLHNGVRYFNIDVRNQHISHRVLWDSQLLNAAVKNDGTVGLAFSTCALCCKEVTDNDLLNEDYFIGDLLNVDSKWGHLIIHAKCALDLADTHAEMMEISARLNYSPNKLNN